ncbi:MAG: restriction endonuclease subunit S [Anaerolineae bacterium]|nr:restriction endonuclease subunit S [Anaerolineae bacterium]
MDTTKTQRHKEDMGRRPASSVSSCLGGSKPLPPGWRWVRLGEVCEINPSRPSNFFRADDAPTSFVPMDAVDAAAGAISKRLLRPFGEVKKGYTYFAEGDVLFAKITPCMQNGKHAIACDLTDGIGFGTTEFHVLRPSEQVLAEWIHFFVRQPHFLLKATEHFTGAVGQQRLPPEFLRDTPIPLPPLGEQRRIAGILREQMAAVEKARAAALARLEAVKALPAAFLRQVFPQPAQPLPSGWRWVRLGEVCIQDRTIVEARSHDAANLPYLGLEDVEPETGRIFKISPQPEEGDGISTTFRFTSDHVLYGKLRPYLNKVALPDFEGRCTTEMIPLRCGQQICREFLALILRRPETVEHAMQGKTGSRMPRADMDHLLQLEIPFPPLSEQRRIAGILREQMAAVERARAAAQAELEAIQALPAALLRRAFSGEL